MTNITARKGLAFGALIALGSTLLAGAPANAAAGVTLAPVAGTSYSVPAGYGFGLVATASSEIPSDRFDEFKFKVTNVDGKDAEAWSYDAYWNDYGYGDYANVSGDAGSSVVLDGYAGGVNNGKFWLESNDSDDTSTYIVTSWLDANDDDVVDAGELQSTQTIKFLKAADITAVTTLTSPIYEGDNYLSATTKFTNINNEMFYVENEDAPYIQFVQTPADLLDTVYTSWDSTNKEYDATTTYVADLPKDKLFSAQAWISFPVIGLVKVGAASLVGSVARSIDSIEGSMVATANNDDDGAVATNSEFTLTFTAYDADDAVVAGKTVKVYLDTDEDYTLSAENGVTVTVNGVKYSTDATLPGWTDAAPLSLVTDAKGQINLKVSTTGLEDGDDLGFYAEAEATVGGAVGSGWYWTEQNDRSYTAWIENNHWADFGGLVGGTINGTVVVYDQFGGLLPNGYDARVQWDDCDFRDVCATSATNSFQAVTNGRASFKVVDNGTGTGVDYYYVEVLKRDTVNGGYTGSSVATVWFDNYFQEAADVVAAYVDPYVPVVSTDSKALRYTSWYGAEINPVAVSTADFGSYDGRAVLGTKPSGLGDNVYFEGGIMSASSATHVATPVVGAPITISGAGLQFKVENVGFDLYGTDSISTTATSGYFAVSVWSHKSGLNSFTIKSGAASQVVEFFVADPLSSAGANVAISGPGFSLPAKYIEATATVTDKFGNPVPYAPLSFEVKGLGWDNYDEYTDSTGKSVLSIGTNVNDLGTLTWTATLNKDSDWDVVGADDIVKTATTVVALGTPVPADAKVSVASAATSQSGRAVDVTVTVTTAAGVAIPGAIVNLSATGAGYLGVTSATTDAAGKVAVKLIGGDNEIGDATVTATAGTVSASAKTAFGVTDANINLAGKRVTVDWSFAAGKRIVIYRNGIQIRNFVAGSDASDSFSFNLKKGTRKIAVKIGGVTIDTQVYVIK